MFNLLVVCIIVGMCGGLHHSHDRNEMVLNAPVTIQKCSISIHPEKRKVRCQKELSGRELVFVQGLFENACEKRSAFVCCEFFLQTKGGKTVGILIHHDDELAVGFDLGREMDAKETHSKHIHNVKMIQNRADQKRLYSLVYELFPGPTKDL